MINRNDLLLTYGVIHAMEQYNSGGRKRVDVERIEWQTVALDGQQTFELPLSASAIDVLSGSCRTAVYDGVFVTVRPPELVDGQLTIAGWRHDVADCPLQLARGCGKNGEPPEGPVAALYVVNTTTKTVVVSLLVGYSPAQSAAVSSAPADASRRRRAS